MIIHDKDLQKTTKSRAHLMRKYLDIKDIQPEYKESVIKFKLDIPWKELAKDSELAFKEFGWYGMVHHKKSDWDRSNSYGGLGVTYNPDYKFDIPKLAHGLGCPRPNVDMVADNAQLYTSLIEKDKYGDFVQEQNNKEYDITNTYADFLGFRNTTDLLDYKSFRHIKDMFKDWTLLRGRLAQIKARLRPPSINEQFQWHRDEPNEFVTRILIPLVYDENYWIELKDGTKINFEPGYAYHWDTYNHIHRFMYNYKEDVIDRTCLVLGISPWLNYKDGVWTPNQFFNKKHPTDMIKDKVFF